MVLVLEAGKRAGKVKEKIRIYIILWKKSKYFLKKNFVAAMQTGQDTQYKTSNSIKLTRFILNSPNCQWIVHSHKENQKVMLNY